MSVCQLLHVFNLVPLMQSDESGHRSSRHNINDPDPLQVPIALAMTQLLLQLPEATLNANLPG